METNPSSGAALALEVLVCFDGAVLAARQLVAGERFAVGDGTEFPLPEGVLDGGRLDVAGIDEHGAFLQFPSGAGGDVTVGTARRTLAELTRASLCPPVAPGVRRHGLAPTARALVEIGPLYIIVRASEPARRLPTPLRFDWRDHRFTAAVGLGLAALLALVFSIPPDPAMAAGDLMRRDPRTIPVAFIPTVPPPVEAAPGPKAPEVGAHSNAKGRPGKAGDPKVDHRLNGRLAIKGSSPITRPAGGVDLREAVKNTGALAILGHMQGGALGTVFDRNETALGDAAQVFNGTLTGLAAGPGYGPGGLGIVGDGPGGGCTGPGCDGTISVGPSLCPGGRCGGSDGRWGPRGPRVPTRTHNPETVEILRREVTVSPNIDRETVRRVIHAHMNQIRHCYERELIASPDLEGKVTVGFVILRDGRVTAAAPRETTIDNPGVPRCVADVIGRLTFPMPASASVAQVSYPFLFRRSGAE